MIAGDGKIPNPPPSLGTLCLPFDEIPAHLDGLSSCVFHPMAMVTDESINEQEQIALCEALDRVLNKGAVVIGEMTISVANIDLIYLGLQLILTSVETARRSMDPKADHLPLTGIGRGRETMVGYES